MDDHYHNMTCPKEIEISMDVLICLAFIQCASVICWSRKSLQIQLTSSIPYILLFGFHMLPSITWTKCRYWSRGCFTIYSLWIEMWLFHNYGDSCYLDISQRMVLWFSQPSPAVCVAHQSLHVAVHNVVDWHRGTYLHLQWLQSYRKSGLGFWTNRVENRYAHHTPNRNCVYFNGMC